MDPHIKRIMRDIREMLEELYAHAYDEGKADQVGKINDAYDRGADEGYVEGERNGYREGKNEVKN